MLRFEHLIQINDPLVPLLTPLTREQIWRGLFIRAHEPTEFVMGLESCTIEAEAVGQEHTVLKRVLDFGPFQVHDEVTLTPMRQVKVLATATELWPRSEATVRIEEPEPDVLFLRFIYELDLQDGHSELDDTVVALRKQAYIAADMDTVQRIRELAESGRLVH
ncbi:MULTISPECIES: SRPBCC family protein [Pigmentiphaga]|uniref:Uncharacterized protein DUF1857 n=1 Tax=Pigmentiphaga kullae TaxID=151784 RepID=A0A4Q7NFQ0_9BURK|nr:MULTISPECIES: SRPBCC family protein [Pigmentiphaga]OVZ64441.1 hypothetical protein CDO46_08950 [Pigmentiphaga sp. NML030171]RZS81906.1 uncharacterized protein DUF1857 [Pigmentiphaga kullae]